MPTTQPLAEDTALALQYDTAIRHLEQAEQALADISDYMTWLTRTMIDELKVRDGRRKVEESHG